MAAVTATILIGTSHPNDVSVDPHYLLRLWEGDRAAWTAHSLTDPTFLRQVLPHAPETVAVEGARLAMDLAREFRLDAVMVCAIEGSSIERGLQAMAAELTEVDVHLLLSVGSRMYSGWKQQWITLGVLAS